MNIGALFIGLGLSVLILIFVSDPFRARNRKRFSYAMNNGRNQSPNHKQVLTALRDLDFDYQTDKISDEDYIHVRSHLLLQAAETLKKKQESEDQIETMIQARRMSYVQVSICSNCGRHLRAGDQFCSHCGKHLSDQCPSCGHSQQPDDLFCTQCGHQHQK